MKGTKKVKSMAKKMTKKEMFAKIAATLKTDVEVVEFCEKEIAALDRKAEKAKERAAKKKAEGDELKVAAKDALTDEFKPAADIVEDLVAAGYDATVGKVIYRLNALVREGVVEKTDLEYKTPEGKKATRKAYKLA